MKKDILFFAFGATILGFVSCDYILKPRFTDAEPNTEEKNIILGADSDSKGCVTSAGYKWSKLNRQCIRVFEKGMRLVPVDAFDENVDEVDLALLNAYLLIDEKKSKAEVFLHSEKESIELDKISDGVYEYKNWKLYTNGKFKLEENNVLKYISPVAIEKQIEGDLEYDVTDAVIIE